MNDLPRTPRTLPCDDEDYFFAFHEDGSNNSVGVEIGTTTSAEDCFVPMFDQRNNAHKKLNFDEALTKRTETENILHTRNGETHGVRQRMKQKRKLYGGKLFSASHLSNKMKSMKLSPVKRSSTIDKFGWQKTAIKIRKKSYHFLKEDESLPNVPQDFADDPKSSSPPSRFTTSLFWKKRPTASSSSLSSSTTFTSRVPKLKWNQQMNSLSIIKPYPELSRPSIATTQGAMELASTDSTASSSCTSRGNDDKRSPCIAPRLESSLHEKVDAMRVEEEDDEGYDSDPEDDMHPEAGSFAFAVGRRCRASF